MQLKMLRNDSRYDIIIDGYKANTRSECKYKGCSLKYCLYISLLWR